MTRRGVQRSQIPRLVNRSLVDFGICLLEIVRLDREVRRGNSPSPLSWTVSTPETVRSDRSQIPTSSKRKRLSTQEAGQSKRARVHHWTKSELKQRANTPDVLLEMVNAPCHRRVFLQHLNENLPTRYLDARSSCCNRCNSSLHAPSATKTPQVKIDHCEAKEGF